MHKAEQLFREFTFTSEVELSIHDILSEMKDDEKKALMRELSQEITLEEDPAIAKLHNRVRSVEEEIKFEHFLKVFNMYSLEELEQLLPEKRSIS